MLNPPAERADGRTMFRTSGSGGSSPVWVTVVAARFVGGLFGEIAGYVIVRGSVNAERLGPGATSTSRLIVLIVPMLLNAVIMGLAIRILVPRMSSRSVRAPDGLRPRSHPPWAGQPS
jgi:hypothetical protein